MHVGRVVPGSLCNDRQLDATSPVHMNATVQLELNHKQLGLGMKLRLDRVGHAGE